MAASMSKSMPAQNALPLPVTMATRAWLFSIASRAVCSSAIICVEMALRFSGRFSVMVARFPVISRRSVEYISLKHLLSLEAERAHTSRESHSSFRVPSSSARKQRQDRRPLFAALQGYPRSRCSRPDCLPQMGNRQALLAPRRTAGIPLRRLREFSLPRSPACCANELRARRRRRDPSHCGTNRQQVAATRCPPYQLEKPFVPEYLLATPRCQPQSRAPTARHKDSQTPSKYKSPDRGFRPMFLSATFRPAIAIRPWTCWHSLAGNTPRWSKDIRS